MRADAWLFRLADGMSARCGGATARVVDSERDGCGSLHDRAPIGCANTVAIVDGTRGHSCRDTAVAARDATIDGYGEHGDRVVRGLGRGSIAVCARGHVDGRAAIVDISVMAMCR